MWYSTVFLFTFLGWISTQSLSAQIRPNQERVRRANSTFFGHYELQPKQVDTKNSNIGDINDSNGIGYAFYFLVDNRLDITINAVGLGGAVTKLQLMCNAPGQQFDCRPKSFNNPNRLNASPCPTVCADVLTLANGATQFPITVSTLVTADEALAIKKNDAYVEIWTEGKYNTYGEMRGSQYLSNPSTQIFADGTLPHGFVDLDSGLGHGFYWIKTDTSNTYKLFSRVYHVLASSVTTENRITDVMRSDGDGLYHLGKLGIFGPSLGWTPGFVRNNPLKATDVTLQLNERDQLLRAEVYFQIKYNPSGATSTRGQLYPMYYPIIDHFTDFATKLDVPSRGYEGAVVSIAVVFPNANIGNEIWVTLPQGFKLNFPSPSAVEFPQGISAPSITMAQGRTVQLRWNASIVNFTNSSEPTAVFTVTNLLLPNNCNAGIYRVATHSCHTVDVQGAGVIFNRQCRSVATDFTMNRTISVGGVAESCKSCAACKHLYDSSTGEKWYSCEQDGQTFFRTNIDNTTCTLY